jgi:hypothetical protein
MAGDYTPSDVARARHQYLRDQGRADGAIDVWPLSGWQNHDGQRFTYHEGGDAREEALCAVVFTDEGGNAEVNFPDGESGTVNIYGGPEKSGD